MNAPDTANTETTSSARMTDHALSIPAVTLTANAKATSSSHVPRLDDEALAFEDDDAPSCASIPPATTIDKAHAAVPPPLPGRRGAAGAAGGRSKVTAAKGTVATSLATMHAFIVSEVTDVRDWLVAVRAPPSTTSGVQGDGGGDANTKVGPSTTAARVALPPLRKSTAPAAAPPSLEQRLHVRGLQAIMHAFSHDVSLPEYLDTLRAEHGAAELEAATAPAWQTAFEAVSQRDEVLCGDDGHRTEREAGPSPGPTPVVQKHGAARSAEALTRFLLARDSTKSNGPGDEETRQTARPRLHDDFTRPLTLESFTEVVQAVVPFATAAEVAELMTKVDYEAHGTISWTDLATFMVSESRHQIHMALAKTELEVSLSSRRLPRTELHESITHVSVDVRKRALLTGGSEGTVRAWALSDLTPRGLLFANKHWISGVHCGHQSRYLFITTLDRELFVLDGNSYEVLRAYHGRPIAETPVGMAYARETLRTVRVGGAKLPTGRTTSVSSSAAATDRASAQAQRQARLQEVLEGTVSSTTATSTSGGGSGGLLKSMTGFRPLTASVAQQALVSHDTTPLTSVGRAPYVESRLAEGVLLGLVDTVVCSLYIHTVLEEDVVLFATSTGDVHIFVLDMHKPASVLRPRRCLTLHPGKAIRKMALLASLDALVTCADDGTVRMTSLINAQLLRVFGAPHLPARHTAVHDMAICDESKMLVTVGPERGGIVWDFGQETPISELEAHNSPCRSCAILLPQQQIVTTAADGSLFVFDMANFHRVQSMQLDPAVHVVRHLLPDDTRQRCLGFGRQPFTLRVKRQATSACPPQYTGPVATMFTSLYTPVFDTIVTVDQDRMVMTWARTSGKSVFAFLLKDFSDSEAANQLRLTTAALDELGRRLLTGFHNGTVVVWNAVNGQPVSLITAATTEGESDADAAPTIVASAHGTRRTRAETSAVFTPRAVAATATTDQSAPVTVPQGRPALTRHDAGAEMRSAAAAIATATTDSAPPHEASGPTVPVQQPPPPPETSGREVTAVGSLVRAGATYLLFASHRTLYTVPESAAFTIARATRWPTPASLGDVTCIAQVTSQSVACGTSHGALFFYNVLQAQQEGATQYAKELVFAVIPTSSHGAPVSSTALRRGSLLLPRSGSFTHGGGAGGAALAGPLSARKGAEEMSSLGVTMAGTHSGTHPHQTSSAVYTSTDATNVTTVCVGSGGAMCVSYLRSVHSRVTRLVPLTHVSPHMFLSLHADGTVSFWQTLRRMYLGCVNLTAAGIDEGKESGGGAVVANVNARSTHVVFADEGGNMHVCHMAFRRIEPESALERAVVTAGNPALYLTSAAGGAPTGPGTSTGAGSVASKAIHSHVTGADVGHVSPQTDHETGTTASRSRAHAEDRVLYVPDVFERVWAFGTGLRHIISVLVIDPKDDTVPPTTGPTEGEEGARDQTSAGATNANVLSARAEPLVVCTDQEHYTRVFTLRGDVVGEVGMSTWDLSDPASYCYMGQPTATLPHRRIPYSKATGDETETARQAAVHFDYLAETYAVQQQARQEAVSAATARRARGRSQLQQQPPRRSSMGSVAGTSLMLHNTSPGTTALAATTYSATSPSHTLSETNPHGATTDTPPVSPGDHAKATAGTKLATSLKAAVAAQPEVTDTTNASGATPSPVGQRAVETASSVRQALDTTIAKRAHIRSGARGRYQGLIKADHAAFVRQQATAAADTPAPRSDARRREGTSRNSPVLFASNLPDDGEARGQADRLDLQSDFLVLVARTSPADGAGTPTHTGDADKMANDATSVTLRGTAAVVGVGDAAGIFAAPLSEVDDRLSRMTTSSSTPCAKGSVATTAAGEDRMSPPSIVSASSSRPSPVATRTPHAQMSLMGSAANAADRPSTAAHCEDRAARSQTKLPTLPNATVTAGGVGSTPSRSGAGFVLGEGLVNRSLSKPKSSTGAPATIVSAGAAARRHKSGAAGSTVAVRPDSASLQADARAFTKTMLSDRRNRILNSAVNTATLRALREADGTEDDTDADALATRSTPTAARRGHSSPTEQASGLSEDLGPSLTPMHEQVNAVLRRRRQRDTGISATLYGQGAGAAGTAASTHTLSGTAAASGARGASGFIAQVASKIYIAPMPTLPNAPATTTHGETAREAKPKKN